MLQILFQYILQKKKCNSAEVNQLFFWEFFLCFLTLLFLDATIQFQVLERSIKVLFTTRDVSQVKQYVQNQCRKIMEEKVSMLDLVFAKEFRGMSGYKPGACVPALEISRYFSNTLLACNKLVKLHV